MVQLREELTPCDIDDLPVIRVTGIVKPVFVHSEARDMKAMDSLLRIFFSNFTIEPVQDGTFKGSKVVYRLNEPWKGFVDSGNFVLGAA